MFSDVSTACCLAGGKNEEAIELQPDEPLVCRDLIEFVVWNAKRGSQ